MIPQLSHLPFHLELHRFFRLQHPSRAEMFTANRVLQLFFLAIELVVMAAAQKGPIPPPISVGTELYTDDDSSWISNSGRFAFGFYRENDGFSVGIRLINSPSEAVVVWTARPELNRFSKDAIVNFTSSGLFVIPMKGAEAISLANFSSTATSAYMTDNGNFIIYGSSTTFSEYSKVSYTTDVPAQNGMHVTVQNEVVVTVQNEVVVTSQAGMLATAQDGKPVTAQAGMPSNNAMKPSGKAGNAYSRGCSAYTRCTATRSSSNSSNIVWRSFDSPTDTILGSQSLPCNYSLTSADGKNALSLQCGGASLVFYKGNSASNKWETGASGDNYIDLNLNQYGRLYLRSSTGNEKDLSGYKPTNISDVKLYRATLDLDGIFRLYALNLDDNSTMAVNDIPYYRDQCEAKNICGVNSYCLISNGNSECNCVPGFEYINRDSHTGGCRRQKAIPSCHKLGSAAPINLLMEAAENILGMDGLAYSVVYSASREECSSACLHDCNCEAASFIDQMCSKLKMPLTTGRRDSYYPGVAFIKFASTENSSLPAAGERRREIRITAIFISVAAAFGIWIVLGTAFFRAHWLLFGRYRDEWRRWEIAFSEEIAPRYFSYQELLIGTNQFKQQLGRGGHGTVFKAELPIAGKTAVVAVKRLYGAETEGEREFHAEMSLIGRAYHVNLIRLLGFCHNGPDQLLVYEYMPKGSLANHIFESKNNRPSWRRRMEILLGAARGIHYLHHECETKIIHRDIKPENILIAEDWTAKISDFGLAKLLTRNQTRVATRTLAAGTEGYIAPECERDASGTGEAHVTEKVDVYSYGMVVLETICSKRNREEKLLLGKMVRERYEANELWKLVDGEQVEAGELEKLVKVGLLCVQEDPIMRPCMEDVVMMIEGDIDV